MERLRVAMSGPGVAGPGLMTFYFGTAGADPAAVHSFLTALVAMFPDDVEFSVPNTGDIIEEPTGRIIGTWTAAGGGVINGSSTQTFQLGGGARVVWETAGIRGGRHVRGTTYLVPIVSTQFDSTGRLSSSAQGAILTAATNFLAGGGAELKIWSRPKGGLNGVVHQVTSARVPQTPTALRSRRY